MGRRMIQTMIKSGVTKRGFPFDRPVDPGLAAWAGQFDGKRRRRSDRRW